MPTPTDSLAETPAPSEAVQPLTALTPTSWAAGCELAVAEWVEQGRCLGAIGRGSGWWIGDWVRYGSVRYGDRYTAASRVTGYDIQSLMNMAYVASRFDASRRRRGLSFSHHAEVAGLAPEDQELWLDRAEAGNLSVRALRAELRKTRERVAARLALARTHGERPPDRARAATSEVLECPHCGQNFAR
ncbi:MAG TPA: LmbU family transcriptional regulator [Thermoleophilaceae bacterium]|nr:LmbU family transcriptional regulator [Thermoleophilaceae bacterium]